MASLFGTLIVSACMSVQPAQQDMCQKTLDAGTRQVGVRQQVDRVEDFATNKAEMTIKSNLSPTQLKVTEVALVGYKVVKDRRAAFRLPNMGLCDSISNEISLDTYNVNLNWRF